MRKTIVELLLEPPREFCTREVVHLRALVRNPDCAHKNTRSRELLSVLQHSFTAVLQDHTALNAAVCRHAIRLRVIHRTGTEGR